ncbi:MAG TPA: hypothetical protein VFQ39_10320 [Longimicrobium sp.]|nr:hypothetical protein [Longimicrobium sp.]
MALALMLAATLAACGDDGGTNVKPKPVDPTENLSTGIHPVLIASDPGPTTSYITLQLRPVRIEARIAGYQGELTYDPATLELTGAEFPSGVEGAWNLASPGVVRFAGTALEGVDAQGTVLLLRYIRKGTVTDQAFTVSVAELVGNASLDDLLPLYVSRDHPLLVESDN